MRKYKKAKMKILLEWIIYELLTKKAGS